MGAGQEELELGRVLLGWRVQETDLEWKKKKKNYYQIKRGGGEMFGEMLYGKSLLSARGSFC